MTLLAVDKHHINSLAHQHADDFESFSEQYLKPLDTFQKEWVIVAMQGLIYNKRNPEERIVKFGIWFSLMIGVNQEMYFHIKEKKGFLG